MCTVFNVFRRLHLKDVERRWGRTTSWGGRALRPLHIKMMQDRRSDQVRPFHFETAQAMRADQVRPFRSEMTQARVSDQVRPLSTELR